jgi:branched-chain amino acid transport system permease protein
VLVFTVTRVIFIPQGEFVAFGALTLASFQAGHLPGTLWLLIGGGVLVAVVEVAGGKLSGRRWWQVLGWNVAYPLLVAGAAMFSDPQQWPLAAQVLGTLLVVVPLGPMVYRLAYQPLAEASVLVLLIVSVAIHLALVGIGLLFFGAEGSRTPAFSEASFDWIPDVPISGQTLRVVGVTSALMMVLSLFFERSLWGKALRATAINRVGARLMGISTTFAGKISFLVAATIGVLSGVLIAPITTVYYDTGFLIGLKGFVGAIVGGMVSYPIAAAGALFVGLVESFSSFWASAFKEVIVFTMIIPVLFWRSLTTRHVDEEE